MPTAPSPLRRTARYGCAALLRVLGPAGAHPSRNASRSAAAPDLELALANARLAHHAYAAGLAQGGVGAQPQLQAVAAQDQGHAGVHAGTVRGADPAAATLQRRAGDAAVRRTTGLGISFTQFIVTFVVLFAATGIGNGSTFRTVGVVFDRVQDAVIRRVRSWAPPGGDAHLQSGGVMIVNSRRVTPVPITLPLGIDPVEMRRRNIYREGSIESTQQPLPPGRHLRLAEANAAHFRIDAPRLLAYWQSLKYSFDEPMQQGLLEYYRLAAQIGEVNAVRRLEWVGPARGSVQSAGP